MAHLIQLMYQAHTTPSFEFDHEPDSMPFFGFSAGRWIDPERMPVSAHQTDKKKIHDIFPMPGLKAVNHRFREVVEHFEPGVHQFFPLKLFHKDGTPVDGEFFIFNCTISVDTLLVNRSDVDWSTYKGRNAGKPFVKAHFDYTWVLSRPAIGQRHVWCGDKIPAIGTFVSDELHAALKGRKIRYFNEKYCEEVDEPWIAEENIKLQLDWEAENPTG